MLTSAPVSSELRVLRCRPLGEAVTDYDSNTQRGWIMRPNTQGNRCEWSTHTLSKDERRAREQRVLRLLRIGAR